MACKDFINELEQFVPFNDVKESTIDVDIERNQYTYENIMFMLDKNKKVDFTRCLLFKYKFIF